MAATTAGVCDGEVVFHAVRNSGSVVPFNPSNWSTVACGHAGWISSEPSDPAVVHSVTRKMATLLSALPGSADLDDSGILDAADLALQLGAWGGG